MLWYIYGMTDDMLISEAAAAWGCHEKSLRNWIKRELIKAEARPVRGQAKRVWFIRAGQSRPLLKRGRKSSKLQAVN